MAGGFWGADVEELQRIAGRFDAEATQLETATSKVTQGVQGQFWVGPVALRFKATWTQSHKAQLDIAARTLRDEAARLRNEAAQQNQASQADGSTAVDIGTRATPGQKSAAPSAKGSASVATGEGATLTREELNARIEHIEDLTETQIENIWELMKVLDRSKALELLDHTAFISSAENLQDFLGRTGYVLTDETMGVVKKIGPIGYFVGFLWDGGNLVVEEIHDPKNAGTDYSAGGILGAVDYGLKNPGVFAGAIAEAIGTHWGKLIKVMAP
jgi:hypothetical protein